MIAVLLINMLFEIIRDLYHHRPDRLVGYVVLTLIVLGGIITPIVIIAKKSGFTQKLESESSITSKTSILLMKQK